MAYKMHDTMKLGKVSLNISNMERSLRFYEDVIGLRVLNYSGQIAQLTADGTTALVELNEITDAIITPPRSVSGLYHFAILVPNRQQLALLHRRLIEKNIRLGQSDHGVSEALYIDDPDGNGIEIYRDRPRDEWHFDSNNQVEMVSKAIDLHDLLAEADGLQWQGMHPDTIIGHVHFHIANIQQAKQFYCDLLGFELMADMRGFRAIFIAAGRYHHHIGLNTWAGEGAPPAQVNGTGIRYYEIKLPASEVLRLKNRLVEHGLQVGEDSEGVFFTDPFGITGKLACG